MDTGLWTTMRNLNTKQRLDLVAEDLSGVALEPERFTIPAGKLRDAVSGD
jgi:hypothetical protein